MGKNSIRIRKRLLELFIDYLVILGYLGLLLLVTFFFYQFILGGIPKLTSMQSQTISTVGN